MYLCVCVCVYIYIHTSKKCEYHEKGQYCLSLISESETHILYIFITQSEIFQAFISWNFDEYGLQIFKTRNSVSQKIRTLPAFSTFGSVGRYQVLLENEISIFIKLVSRRKHEVL